MKALFRYFDGYRRQLVLGPLFKLTEAVLELFVPLLMANIIDVGIKNGNVKYVVTHGLFMLGLGAVGLACALTCQYFAAVCAQGFGRSLRKDLFRHVFSLSQAEYGSVGTNSLITRLTSDVNQVQTGVNMFIRLAIRAPFLTVGSIVMAFTINWKIALVFLLSTPLIVFVLYLFEQNPDIRLKWQKRLEYIMVDEFQDIDRLQLRLLRAWRREGGTFFAIGDPDQSIYGFRGADAGCFSALGAERTVRLTENYRSTPEILAAALPVAEAIDGAPRRMETHSPHGAEVRLLTDEGDRAEAIFVAKEIARMVGGIGMLEAQALGAARGARSFGDIAVLYRTRRQAALLEECLAHDGIPCVVTGREDFLLDGEVQDAMAWLERQQGEGKSPAALLEEWTAHHTPSGGVERLRNMAVFFGDVTAFLRNLTIGQEGDLLRRAGLSYAAGAVTLSTLHGAKGLEWPVVFLCGVGEGRIPLERKGLDTDEAEERRLLYVGMTRAREELVLLSGGEPSRFLAGLPLRQDTAHAPVPRPLGVQLSLFK